MTKQDDPTRSKIRLTISKEILDWFHSTYPGMDLSWVVEVMLVNFRDLHQITPEELAHLAAIETKKMGEV